MSTPPDLVALSQLATRVLASTTGADNLYTVLGVIGAGLVSTGGILTVFKRRTRPEARAVEAAQPVAAQTARDAVNEMKAIYQRSFIAPLERELADARQEADTERRARVAAERSQAAAERIAETKLRETERVTASHVRITRELGVAQAEIADLERRLIEERKR